MAQRDGAFNPPPPADRTARRSKKKRCVRVPSLPDDLAVEILSRVPYRSLCRFRCVSRSWLALCSDPDLCKRSPQTLSGFFCYSRRQEDDYANLRCPHFLNLSGRGRPLVDPSPPLLEGHGKPLFVQCCSSLLLWKFSESSPLEPEYVVSNPATQKWILLPRTEARHLGHFVRLGFDPAVPSCFYAFMFVTPLTGPNLGVAGVEIYSSETGRWIFRESQWGDNTRVEHDTESVFFNDTLYSSTRDSSVVTIDAQGTTWRKIRMPRSHIQSEPASFITHSQNRLYAMHIDSRKNNRLSVWALEADGNDGWTLEHSASITRLLGRHYRRTDELYMLVAAHPDGNLVFFAGGARDELISYDMDDGEVGVICTLQKYFLAPCFPYIPCFAELSSAHD